MKGLLIVANWKSNKTISEANTWLEEFKRNYKKRENTEIVLCIPFTILYFVKNYLKENNLDVKLGAQDVSIFSQGSHTGEVNAEQIKELADYVLIGHSERKEAFGETDETLSKKTERAIEASLTPIFFVQDVDGFIPEGIKIVVYEPPGSISTVSGGIPDSVDNVSSASEKLRNKGSFEQILYGASVNPENVSTFTSLPFIDGIVSGKASLDPLEFSELIKNA